MTLVAKETALRAWQGGMCASSGPVLVGEEVWKSLKALDCSLLDSVAVSAMLTCCSDRRKAAGLPITVCLEVSERLCVIRR